MSKKIEGDETPFNPVPIDGQSADAGLCVDGVCAIGEPALARPMEFPATGSAEQGAALPPRKLATMTKLTLISSPLCPFVQRAIIALKEKQMEFEVVYVDLANKPDWFLAISPLGKVPLLKVERDGREPAYVFESAVILEYLEETASGPRLYPEDPLERAEHRSWMEYGSQILVDLWKFGTARDAEELEATATALRAKYARIEEQIVGPWFSGEDFSYVDAVFAPAFRQIDAIETVRETGLFDAFPKLHAWRRSLSARPSVRDAVPADFVDRYLALLSKNDAFMMRAG